jgi:hypothetical protein
LSDTLTDLFQGDAIGNRIYEIKEGAICSICRRSLKGKTAYLKLDNKWRCYDESTENPPIESMICRIVEGINKILVYHGIKASMQTTKKIDKALKDQLL